MSSPSGFDIPRPTKDPYVQRLYQEYGLPEAPTLRQIEVIAVGLLGSAQTLIIGAELTIGRRLQENDPIFYSVDVRVLDAEERFAFLLMSELTGQEAEADPKTQVLWRVYDWISKNRPDLEPYFQKSNYLVVQKDGIYSVNLAIHASQGYETLSLKVNLALDTVELVNL